MTAVFSGAMVATFATANAHPTSPALICAWEGGHCALGSAFAGTKLFGAAAAVVRTTPARVMAPVASVVPRTTWDVSAKPPAAFAGDATPASPLVCTNATVVVAGKPVHTTDTAMPAVAPGTAQGRPLYVQLDVDGGIGVAAAGAAVSATSNAPRSPSTPTTAVTRRRNLPLCITSPSRTARTKLSLLVVLARTKTRVRGAHTSHWDPRAGAVPGAPARPLTP